MSDSSYNAQLPGLDPLRAEGEALHWVGTMGVMGEIGGLAPFHAPNPAAPSLRGPPFAATSAGLTVVHHGPRGVMPPTSSSRMNCGVPLSIHCGLRGNEQATSAAPPPWGLPLPPHLVSAGMSGAHHRPPWGMPAALPPADGALPTLSVPPPM